MTAPTSDERREVADSLRARAAGVGFAYRDVYALNNGWVYRTLREIVEAIGCVENPHPAEWMARLADLIDPTCHKVIPSEIEGYVFCSKCGAEIGEYGVPNYCHNCGARVVRDDGRD